MSNFAGAASDFSLRHVVFFDLETLVLLVRERSPGSDALDRLRKLAGQHRLGVIANDKEEAFLRRLKALEDLGRIISDDLLISASDLRFSLQDPRSFLIAAAIAGEPAARCIFVSSDSLLLVSAAAAGMKPVSYPVSATAVTLFPERNKVSALARVIDEDKGPTFVLKGRVVTMNSRRDVIDEAKIAVQHGRIVEIVSASQDLSPEFGSAPEIDTGGTIYPGLIDLHNHFVYNVLPLWPLSRRYTNRNRWSKAKEYIRDVSLPIRALANNSSTARAIVRYVEAKALIGGTTTGQGIKTQVEGGTRAFRGAMRNVEETEDPRLPEAGTHVPDLQLTEKEIDSFRRSLERRAAYFYHLAEGVDGPARQRFVDLASNDLVKESLVGIHSLGLHAEDLSVLNEKGSKVVWSPFSNLLLYGKTLDLKSLKASGALFSIGCDWSPTGGKNLLQELKVARYEVQRQGADLHSEDLVRAVTCNPARTLTWQQYLGTLMPGAFADLLVVRGTYQEPYDHLINATEPDIELVVIHGTPRYGSHEIMQSLHSEPERELEELTIGGKDKAFNLYSSGSGLNDLTFSRSQEILQDAMKDLPAFLDSSKKKDARLRALGIDIEQRFRVLLDNELETDGKGPAGLRAASMAADWSKIAKSVELDRPEVNTSTYWQRLDAQASINDDLKDMLKNAYNR